MHAYIRTYAAWSGWTFRDHSSRKFCQMAQKKRLNLACVVDRVGRDRDFRGVKSFDEMTLTKF